MRSSGGAVRIGARMAVGRDRAIDQPGVDFRQFLVAQAELVECSRAVILDEDIGALDQLVQHLEAARILEVDAQALLAHVLLQVVTALPVDEISVGATGVACRRALDLDHIGAERREIARNEGAGQEVAVVDDADAGKRKLLSAHE